jgi:enediyne biosynthesis protein E4
MMAVVRLVKPAILLGIAAAMVCSGAGVWWIRQSAAKNTTPRAKTVTGAWFREVSTDVGVAFRQRSGPERRFWFPEIVSGGACLFDYDADGYLDIYFVQSGDLDPSASDRVGNQLYRNKGNGQFENVTEKTGTGDTGYGVGCTCADFDSDGDVDLYVTNVGANVLYRNEGNGTFVDATVSADVGDVAWGASAAFLDYDSDGDLDLYVVNYINWSIEREIECSESSGTRVYCSPNNYTAPAPDTLYRNNGDGTFTDVSSASGIRTIFGNGLGIACADYDRDGRIDIYVANDGMPNQLWMNKGNGRFVDDAVLAGCAVNNGGTSEAGMGVTAVDIENDGDWDLFLSHLRNESNTFYLNGGTWFEDRTAEIGLAAPSIEFTGFGLGFADFNHDGKLDLYIANGRVIRDSHRYNQDDIYAEPNLLFSGVSDLRTDEILPRGGVSPPLFHTSRAAAFGDIDNDGDIDIVVVNKDAPAYVLENIASTAGHAIMFKVIDRSGGHALHADVTIQTGSTVRRSRVQRAYSYCASNDPRVHFGLGSAQRVDRVAVRWPDGIEESFGPFDADALHTIQRGTGR